MIDLEVRLAELGDALDVDESDLVAAVVAGLGSADAAAVPERGRLVRRPTRAVGWRVAAAAVVVLVVALLALPSSRRAIAEWLGLAGVEVERRPELSVPAAAPTIDLGSSPAEGTVVVAGDLPVLVDEIEVGELSGRLDEASISKTLAAATGLERVTVGGDPGLWIDGQPPVVSYVAGDGTITSERFAGNTLLWQDGDVIRRIEGFPSLDQALAFAATFD